MDKEFLHKLINQIVIRLSNGEQVEENKIELKREWYKFYDKDDRKKAESEFLKDISAIANTPGPTGYLLIGIDEKTVKLTNSPFSECGLKDESDLYKLVVKSVDKPIEFELSEITYKNGRDSFIISVMIVPPSLDKPHIISKYYSKNGQEIQNYIPVKKLTGVFPASRSDLEFMYYDRKNIEPEFALEILLYKPKLLINSSYNEINIDFQLCFQNYGRKPITIVDIKINIDEIEFVNLPDSFILKLNRYYLDYSTKSSEYYIASRYIIVPSNEVITIYGQFKAKHSEKVCRDLRDILSSKKGNFKITIEAIDLNEKRYSVLLKDYE